MLKLTQLVLCCVAIERWTLKKISWTDAEMQTASVGSLEDAMTHKAGTDLWRQRSHGIHLDIASEIAWCYDLHPTALLQLTDAAAVALLKEKEAETGEESYCLKYREKKELVGQS
jgi:hypothetical protein